MRCPGAAGAAGADGHLVSRSAPRSSPRRQYQVRDLLQRTEEASQQKDQFLAVLAHELRNPLAPMSNAVHLMRMRGGLDPATERVSRLWTQV